jgi:hypothetical protein
MSVGVPLMADVDDFLTFQLVGAGREAGEA